MSHTVSNVTAGQIRTSAVASQPNAAIKPDRYQPTMKAASGTSGTRSGQTKVVAPDRQICHAVRTPVIRSVGWLPIASPKAFLNSGFNPESGAPDTQDAGSGENAHFVSPCAQIRLRTRSSS